MEFILLGVVFLLVLLNGFFVAAEFAVVRARPARLQALADEGNKRAALALDQIKRMDEFVASSQVGITLSSIAIGFLGEPAIAHLLEPVIEGAIGAALAYAISLILAYMVITLLHVILGEQAPKMIGIAAAETLLMRISRLMSIFRMLFTPLIILTNAPAQWLVKKLFRLEISGEDDTSAEDVRIMIARGAAGGRLDAGEAMMLSGVFHLHEQRAREVMTPIPEVAAVDKNASSKEVLASFVRTGHTRLLVIEDDNMDKVVGTVHNNSVIELNDQKGATASIEDVINQALVIPESKPLDDLLTELQQSRSSIAIVADEYGRTVGVVSIEDIIEEIVGEIEDETDPSDQSIKETSPGIYQVSGHLALGDLESKDIHLTADSEAYNSVGGFVFSHLGHLPKVGEMLEIDGFKITVEEVENNRIVLLTIKRS
jgi:CBS domain containing-hemolysin-like protein